MVKKEAPELSFSVPESTSEVQFCMNVAELGLNCQF